LYRWWVFIHIVAVVAFLVTHGVSIWVSFRLRKERDPGRVSDLLALSGSTTKPMYVSLAVLVAAGIVAGSLGGWWSEAWIWVALVVLVASTLAMYVLARGYYQKVRTVAKAKAAG